MVEDFEGCYRAVSARDARFDGWFFTGVRSTGIYCRPSCPAVTPKRSNVRFFPTAAAAEAAGLRACLRCRPDAVPGSPEWNGRADVVARAVKLIADGLVDRDGVAGLARALGYGSRQLHRLLQAELGCGPLALARAQRSRTARILIETTDLPMAAVAFSAGFSSIRQFNDTVRQVFGRTPTALRARRLEPVPGDDGLRVRLAYREPFDPADLLGFLGTRAVPGVEEADGEAYRRSLRLPHGTGVVSLRPAQRHVEAALWLDDLRDLTAAVSRCRRLLDLDADPIAVDRALSTDPLLGPVVRAAPGRRIPGAVDGFEIAVRAVVGQQVSVAGARTVAGRLAAQAGRPLVAPRGGVTRMFPDPGDLLGAPDGAFAMPSARRSALRALAEAVLDGRLVLDAAGNPVEAGEALMRLPGIGPWTAGYVTMRAFGDPDVFLATDIGLLKGLTRLGGPAKPRAADAVAERWRPWRSYASVHLWAAASAHLGGPAQPMESRGVGREVAVGHEGLEDLEATDENRKGESAA